MMITASKICPHCKRPTVKWMLLGWQQLFSLYVRYYKLFFKRQQTPIIIIEGGVCQAVYGVESYRLIDVDDLKETKTRQEIDDIIDSFTKGQEEAVQE